MASTAFTNALLYPINSHNASLSFLGSPARYPSARTPLSALLSTQFNTKQAKLITNCASSAGETEETPIELSYPAFPTVMDINQIREILPHRFPFLLVDRVIEYKAGVSAVAIKNVTINDNFFPGHFPERPIMPGVLMVEFSTEARYEIGIIDEGLPARMSLMNVGCCWAQAMAQVGGLVMLQPEVGGSRDNFFFAGIDKMRFRKPVIAGDTLLTRMTLTKLQKRFGIAKMEGRAYVGGEVVCEGEFIMAMGRSIE
ncbi:LOW QUALITY PROTEIN: hypothetical protein RJ639_036016 [Escallonia herrerae]|uniref:3-hydroxyacyl-[acyl-carrier-protein] dehydratase FabZ n=1 Tax=Escallonia herrerae TaxID=1293975 RepID=A0AA89BBZ2_9ASTE|nr:LOW QUALITY PROTEIN: hypothetical protein RJ639_036016 [Escallonia herrerae]